MSRVPLWAPIFDPQPYGGVCYVLPAPIFHHGSLVPCGKHQIFSVVSQWPSYIKDLFDQLREEAHLNLISQSPSFLSSCFSCFLRFLAPSHPHPPIRLYFNMRRSVHTSIDACCNPKNSTPPPKKKKRTTKPNPENRNLSPATRNLSQQNQ